MSNAPNNRIFYACQAVAIGQFADSTNIPSAGPYEATVPVHGVQSVGINTTFNLEQAFELGQISIYENIEGLPDVEVTIEKVLDGYPLIYLMATSGADGNTLVNRTKRRCNVGLGIYSDDEDAVSGIAPVQVFMSGMYVNSVSYTLPTDGNATESITLVGNSKAWLTGTQTNYGWTADKADDFQYGGDTPPGAGGIQRREDVLMNTSIIPATIFGVVGTSAGNNWNSSTNKPRAHIQNITISTDLGREDVLELGQKEPYYRSPNFPVEVTSEFEVIAVSGDFVNAYANQDNTSQVPIKVILRNGTTFDLGSKNRLSSVNYTGGDAGGGNATITYSFATFNDLTVTTTY